MTGKIFSRGLVAAATLAASLAFTAGAQAEPFRLIVTDVQTPLVPNSVMDLALQLGYFEREGVDVEIIRVEQTPSALAALQAGQGDMANLSLDSILQAVGRGGVPLVAVVSPNKSLPYLIAAQDDVATIADLAGRTFGIGSVGSLDHSLSTRVLASAGIDTEGLQFVALGQPSIRAQALAAGQVDATTMSIGVWMSLPDQTGMHVLIDQDAYYEAAPVVNKANVVTREVLETRRDEVEGVIRALILASRDFAADPATWVAAMQTARPDTAPETLTALGDAFAQSWSVNGGLNREELEYTVDWLYSTPDFADLMRLELADWVDFSLIDDVLADIGAAEGTDQPVR